MKILHQEVSSCRECPWLVYFELAIFYCNLLLKRWHEKGDPNSADYLIFEENLDSIPNKCPLADKKNLLKQEKGEA